MSDKNDISLEDLSFAKLQSAIRHNRFSGKIEIAYHDGEMQSSRLNVSTSEIHKVQSVATVLEQLKNGNHNK